MGGGNGVMNSSNGGDGRVRGENESIPEIIDAPSTKDIASGNSETMEDSATVKRKKPDSFATEINNNVSKESPVGSGVWDLIEKFLQRRAEFHPHTQRQIHWTKIDAEAKSRLDHFVSISSTAEEDYVRSLQSTRSSFTPCTPMFSVIGRGSATLNQSLTPLSSNRNPPKSKKHDSDVANAIPSWNFINRMVRRCSQLCTQSCQSFRSQPFLAELQNETKIRCEMLETLLVSLKRGKRNSNGVKRDGSTVHYLAGGKRRKLGTDVNKQTAPSLFRHLRPRSYLKSTKTDLNVECDCNEDHIVETRMKIHLWKSLLSSLNEIVGKS